VIFINISGRCKRLIGELRRTKSWLLRGFVGDYTIQPYGDYFRNHEIRMPRKHPGFNGKYPSLFFVPQVDFWD